MSLIAILGLQLSRQSRLATDDRQNEYSRIINRLSTIQMPARVYNSSMIACCDNPFGKGGGGGGGCNVCKCYWAICSAQLRSARLVLGRDRRVTVTFGGGGSYFMLVSNCC